MAKKNLVSLPAARIAGTVEIEVKRSIDRASQLPVVTLEREDCLQYVADIAERKAVLAGASAATQSATAVCMSIIADVIDANPHIINMSRESKSWRAAFAEVDKTYFENGASQLYMTCKSTVKRFLSKAPDALVGDAVIRTADGQLNSLRFLKKFIPATQKEETSIADKVIEACEGENAPTVSEVVASLLNKVDDEVLIFESFCDRFGEERMRSMLAQRIKARRASLRLAA